jgi:hypothetical protein
MQFLVQGVTAPQIERIQIMMLMRRGIQQDEPARQMEQDPTH